MLHARPGDLEAALTAYEKELFPRSAAEAADSEGVLAMCIGPDAPRSLVDFLLGHRVAEQA